MNHTLPPLFHNIGDKVGIWHLGHLGPGAEHTYVAEHENLLGKGGINISNN